MNENSLQSLFVLIAVLLIAAFMFYNKNLLSSNTDGELEASVEQTQPSQKVQDNEKQTNNPSKRRFAIPFDEDISAKIKKVFEPILSEDESEEMGRSYSAIGYNIAIMPDLYDDLHSQHLSEEEQVRYKKLLSAHQQALEILRQNKTLNGKQSDEPATPIGEEEFYLPGLDAIKGLKGQQQTTRKEIECPDRYTDYKTWDKICQEIQFADMTKSIVYVVSKRGITAREDFDAQGHLLVQHRFLTTGGYFDPDKIRHIPYYPATVSKSIFYDKNGDVIQKKTQLSDKNEAGKAKYCDLYKLECDVL